MGEKEREALKLQFDRRLRLEFHGARITSDAGLLACRELDGALRLTEVAPVYLQETRGGRNVQHELVPPLRQSVYSRLAGYEDTNDAEKLARDPAMQAVVGRRALEKQAASTNTLSRFETEVLVSNENVRGLRHLNTEWVDQAMVRTRHQRLCRLSESGCLRIKAAALKSLFSLAVIGLKRDWFLSLLWCQLFLLQFDGYLLIIVERFGICQCVPIGHRPAVDDIGH